MNRSYDVPALRSRSIPRSRLIALMGTGAARTPLTLVTGHAGGGKSTLLAQWARSIDLGTGSLIWIGLQADDTGVQQFWYRVGLALGLHTLAEDATLKSLQGGATGINIYQVIQGALRQHELEVTIVVDDYQLVASDLIDEQIARLITNTPALRVVIGSRSTTGLHATDVAARIETTFISPEALSLTASESRELVAASEWGDDPELAAAIHKTTLGWPLASQALLVEVRRAPTSAPSVLSELTSRPQFVENFVSRTLAGLTDTDREFLLRICFADECTVALASTMSGQSTSITNAQLSRLEVEGLGTWQQRGSSLWFRLHPLLREAFESASLSALTPVAIARLRSVLANELALARPMKALELAFAAEDWVLMSNLTVLHWLDFSYYHREASTALLREVPHQVARKHPSLLGARIVQDYGDASVPIANLTAEFGLYSVAARKHHPTPNLIGALQEVLHAGAHRIFGDMTTSVRKAESALSTLAHSSAAELRQHGSSVPILHVQVGITWLINGDYARALASFERATGLAVELRSLGEQFQVLALSAFTHALRGDMREAQLWISLCEEADPYDGWLGGYLQAGYHLAQALVALNRGDLVAARQALQDIHFVEPVIEYWPYMAVIQSHLDVHEAGPTIAYTKLQEHIGRKRWRPNIPEPLEAMLLARRVSLLIMAGQTARADSELSATKVRDTPELTLARAHLAWAQGSYTLATSLAESVVWSSDDSPLLRTTGRIIVAMSTLDAAEIDRAAEAFGDAATELIDRGLRAPLALLPDDHQTRLIAAAEARSIMIPPQIAAMHTSAARAPRTVQALSRAERRVLAAVTEQGTATAAAGVLHLSEHTVRYHLKRIYKKLGASDRAEAIVIAQEHGMLDSTPPRPDRP